jgi:protein-S-isoprenylcysteine O-methyltransferase Ste14
MVLPPTSSSLKMRGLGLSMVVAGELIRLAAVRHIGTISRTRTDRLGPLVASGPFRWVRNPLYIGNIALWGGLTLVANLPWLVAPVAVLLAVEYHAIVRWEEQLLGARLGNSYHEYMGTVPRWVPKPPGKNLPSARSPFGWGETLFSERGTLIAISVGLALLWLKSR